MPFRIALFAWFVGLSWLGAAPAARAAGDEVHVYKTPRCGCCTKWMDHLRAAGFAVRGTDVADLAPIKLENGLPHGLASCHTAFVGGYLVEGHVPASDVRRLLRERPKVAGLAVPEMPIGSPGMEGPSPEPYEVYSFGPGGVKVFSRHDPR
jgi:hypothetical protein